MRKYPRLAGKSLDAVYGFCREIASLRSDDADEVYRLSQNARAVSTLAVNVTQVGNVTTGEDNLMGHLLPDGLFTKNGHYIVVEGAFTTAANANTKTVKFYFGTSLIGNLSGTLNDKALIVRCTITRISASSQVVQLETFSNDATVSNIGVATRTENLFGPITLQFTGEGTATNDILQKSMHVRWFPANIELV